MNTYRPAPRMLIQFLDLPICAGVPLGQTIPIPLQWKINLSQSDKEANLVIFLRAISRSKTTF